MRRSVLLLAFVSLASSHGLAQPQSRNVDMVAPDGVGLKGTYFAASRPGPIVLLMHMCNTTRVSWEPVARQLADAGISALTMDNRGFGESGGPRFDGAAPEVLAQLRENWAGDFGAAHRCLVAHGGAAQDRLRGRRARGGVQHGA